MKRRKKEINIFSMSALDLFASAMGAFILIAVAALPYYLKTDKSLFEDVKQLEKDLASCEDAQEKIKTKLQQAESQKKQLEKQLEDSVKFALLGITTKAESFVFVVDMSGSMDTFTSLMEDTMKRLLEPLDDRNSIQIVGYNGDIGNKAWKTPYNLTSMNNSNKSQALRFIKTLSNSFSGSTPTENALEHALKYDAESIVLLTDGAPDNDSDQIIRNITRQNGGTKEIHSIAIGDYNSEPELVLFLQELAAKNDGGFVGVSK